MQGNLANWKRPRVDSADQKAHYTPLVTEGEGMALSNAERQARFVARLKAGIAPTKRAKTPQDRRSRPQRWKDAVAELHACLDAWQEAREAVPEALAEGAYALKLDAMLELQELVEQLDAADPPLGFGRD